jgi:hypothetical protein
MDRITLHRLTAAYIRRQSFEADVIAARVGRMLFGEVTGGKVSNQPAVRKPAATNKIDGGEMLEMMGVSL